MNTQIPNTTSNKKQSLKVQQLRIAIPKAKEAIPKRDLKKEKQEMLDSPLIATSLENRLGIKGFGALILHRSEILAAVNQYRNQIGRAFSYQSPTMEALTA